MNIIGLHFLLSLFFISINGYNLLTKPNEVLRQYSPSKHYFNVKKFGAKGDGVTDDTRAIQDAINNAAKKGGVIFFPNGVYNIAGPILESVDGHACHAQLYIPYSDIENPKNIVFMGETAPEFEMQGIIEVFPSMNGAILSSSIITNDSSHFVISMLKGPEGDWLQWNYTTPSFKDIGIRTCTLIDSTPVVNSLGGINLRYATKCYVDNVLIDTNSPLANSVNPAPGGSTGLVTPEINNHAMVDVGLIRVGGYAYGLKFSEHFVGKDIQVVCCNVGIFVEDSHHSSSIQTLEIECCEYSVVFRPGHNLFVANYNTEHFPDDRWFKFKQDVTFIGDYYYPIKMVIGLCHPVVSYKGYDPDSFSTNMPDRVVLLEYQK